MSGSRNVDSSSGLPGGRSMRFLPFSVVAFSVVIKEEYLKCSVFGLFFG